MSRVAVEPPSQSPKHGGSGNSRPFLSSSFLEPSSFHLGNYSSPISLSSPIFYQAASAAANAITGDFHGDKRQVHPNPAEAQANRERNALEQQRLKNEKLIVDYLSQIEISCNEDVQRDCKPFLSILRRTLKVRVTECMSVHACRSTCLTLSFFLFLLG
jgi:hypothetical protein